MYVATQYKNTWVRAVQSFVYDKYQNILQTTFVTSNHVRNLKPEITYLFIQHK